MTRHARITLFISLTCLFLGLFSLHLWTNYQILEKKFLSQEEFIPTRIYSDIIPISLGQSRNYIEIRLKRLGYSTHSSEQSVTFTLHPINYPSTLIPSDRSRLEKAGKLIALQFDHSGKDASLQQIHSQENDLTEVFLEPELIATLSRSNSPETNKIRKSLKFQDIPASVWKAIIAIEDRHFLEHKGLDPRGILRALWINIKTLSLAQGGSTITQQLVKNLMARKTKSFFRKLSEVILAVILEARFEKEEILERYLNEVYLGQIGNLEIHGVEEGAKYFFGKTLEELNLAEIALMTGLIRGPSYYSPYRHWDRAMERQYLILEKMVETGQIAPDEINAALKQPIQLAPPPTAANIAPHFTDFVQAEMVGKFHDRMSEEEISNAGFKIYTTLDAYVNDLAQTSVQRGLEILEKSILQSGYEGILAAVDHKTGYLRALIGGRNYNLSTFNRILNMKRQIGSTFKPIVYLTALQEGLNPAYPLNDSPWTLIFDNNKQKWSPKNYPDEYRGWISIRTALTHSVNIATAKLGIKIGIKKIIQTAKNLGIESELPSVPSLSLGTAELSPIELLKVYATLSNRGIQNALTSIRIISYSDGTAFMQPEPTHHSDMEPTVIEPGVADLMTHLLQDVFVSGTARRAEKLGLKRPAAGKTGTTSNFRDSWFAGFTPELTAIVWVGMDRAVSNNEVPLTGASAALPIWVDFIQKSLSHLPLSQFPISENLAKLRIDRYTGNLADSNCPENQVLIEENVIGKEPKKSSCEPSWPIDSS